MRIRTIAMVLGLAACGCARSKPAVDAASNGMTTTAIAPAADVSAAPRLGTPEQARAAFLSGWNLLVLPHARDAEREPLAAIDQAMRDVPEKLVATTEACRTSKATVERINREANHDFVVYGALDDLDRDGDCWRVSYEGGAKLEAIGYLDPSTGRLLAVWRVPEG